MGNRENMGIIRDQPKRWEQPRLVLGSCCPPVPCLLGYFLPCVAYGKLARDGFGKSCLLWGLCTFAPFAFCLCHYKQRRELRSRRNIRGVGCLKDCFAVTCCPCCAIIQEAKEVQAERANN